MRLTYLLITLVLSCASNPDEVQQQQQKITRAETLLNEERTKLQSLQDSLQIKIAQNIKLGLPPAQAEAIEQALIKTQETLVTAAEHNVHAQKALQDSLKKYTP